MDNYKKEGNIQSEKETEKEHNRTFQLPNYRCTKRKNPFNSQLCLPSIYDKKITSLECHRHCEIIRNFKI